MKNYTWIDIPKRNKKKLCGKLNIKSVQTINSVSSPISNLTKNLNDLHLDAFFNIIIYWNIHFEKVHSHNSIINWMFDLEARNMNQKQWVRMATTTKTTNMWKNLIKFNSTELSECAQIMIDVRSKENIIIDHRFFWCVFCLF